MGVSNLDEVVIVTRAKERFEYRRGGQPLLCRRESRTYPNVGTQERIYTLAEKKDRDPRGVKIFSNLTYICTFR